MRILLAALLLFFASLAFADNPAVPAWTGPAQGGTFPKPDPDKAFAELKSYDAKGHPWRVAVEDWAGAKQRVASDPAWAKWLKDQQGQVDAWMATKSDRVAWTCGWYHNFVSPKDGSFVTWEPKVPGEEAPFFHSPTDPQIEITPKLMGGWVFFFRGRNVHMVQEAAQLYRLTGDEKYAAWAAGQIDFYAQHYLEWPASHDGSHLTYQTLDEAGMSITLAEAARLLGSYVAPDRKATWRTTFFQPVVDLLNTHMLVIHNIAIWHRSAAAQIALLYDDKAMWDAAINGPYGIKEQFEKGATSDYVWWEQSFHYNEFLMQAVTPLFTVAGIEGKAEELGPTMTIAENLLLSPIAVRFPDGHLPNPADSTSQPSAPDLKLMSDSYRVFPIPLAFQKANERRDWETLLDPPPAPPATPVELPPVVAHSLETTRMALIKSGPWQAFLHYGQLTKSHAQHEALNFSAYFNDTDVTHDPGTAVYGSAMYKKYYTRGLGQNVPLVNGEGEEVIPQPGELKNFAANSVEASQPTYTHDSQATRNLTIDGDKLTDTVTITTTETTPQALGISLHVQGKAQLPASFKADATLAQGRPEPFGYWKDVTECDFTDRATIPVDFGSQTLLVTFAVPGPFKLWHANTPDFPPKRREGFYVEVQGTQAVITTTFAPVTK